MEGCGGVCRGSTNWSSMRRREAPKYEPVISLAMEAPVDHVRVSPQSREILNRLKLRTGITQWNILCRWAYCASLAQDSEPKYRQGKGTIELMDWQTFAGSQSVLFANLLALRLNEALRSRSRPPTPSDYFRAHVERGIEMLHSNSTLNDLLSLLGRNPV